MTRRMRKWTFSVACQSYLFCYSLSLPYIKKHTLCTTEKSVIPHRRYVYFYPITKGAFPLFRFMSAPQARVLSFKGIPKGKLFLFCGGKLRKRVICAFQFMLCGGKVVLLFAARRRPVSAHINLSPPASPLPSLKGKVSAVLTDRLQSTAFPFTPLPSAAPQKK